MDGDGKLTLDEFRKMFPTIKYDMEQYICIEWLINDFFWEVKFAIEILKEKLYKSFAAVACAEP